MLRFAAVIAAMMFLTGCAGSLNLFDRASGKVGQFLCGETYAAEAERDSRALCLGMGVVVVSELSADRVSRYRPDEAEAAYGSLTNLRETLNRVRSLEGRDWFFAELFDAERLIQQEAERAARRGIAAILIPGFDEVSARAAVGLTGKFSAIRSDVQFLVGQVQSGERTMDEVWTSIIQRVGYNAERVDQALKSK